MQTKLRELFGLDEADELIHEVTLSPPATLLGHGLMAASMTELADELKLLSHFTADPALGRSLGIDAVARWDGDARVIALGAARVTGVRGAAEIVPELGWIIDTRGELSAVVVRAADGASRIFAGERGEVTIARLQHARYRSIPLRELPPLELPALDRLLAQLEVHAWLREAVSVRARAGAYVRCIAAVGLARRLALGAVEVPGRLLDELGTGVDPLRELDDWARSLPPESVSTLEGMVLDAAQALAEEISAWARQGNDGAPGATAIATLLRTRRDDLESAAYVLRTTRADTPVVDALGALDALAAAHLSAFDAAGADGEDDLFAAVSAAQPEAWWGTTWTS